MLFPCLDSYFVELKKCEEECDQKDWNSSDEFGIITLSFAKYHLKVGAPVSLKAATKSSLQGKKALKA